MAANDGRIPLFRPLIREEAIEAVGDVLRSGWLGLGPRTAAFESAFAAYVGAPHCVGLSSCSASLELALTVLDLPPGGEVVTTPLTFVATNQTIVRCGLRPVFADVDPTTGNLDPADVERRIGERTVALMLVHYGGYPCDLDELYSVARRHELVVVEDCAHAAGALYHGRRVGSHGDLHAFSFNPVKNLPMGEGGALTVRSEEHAARLRRLRWFGISADTYDRASGASYRWDYDVLEPGFKAHLNDVQAAVGLAQLAYLDQDNARRAAVAERYREGLGGVAGLELLRRDDDREGSNHLFSILADERDRLVDRLAAERIDAGVHYRPSYDFAIFDGEPLAGVESFWRREVSLPMHVALTDDEVDRVVGVIRAGW